MRILLLAPAVACLLAAQLPAQDNTELLNRLRAMEDRVRALEAEVQTLKARQTVPAPTPPATAAVPEAQPTAPPAPAALPVYGGAAGGASKVFNPDISLIGDFVGAAGNSGNRPTPSLEMHESELGLQAIIDPYARGDVFITFGEQGVSLEEGYLTFTSLPGALQLKVGKMRAAFGKVNTLHNHVLPWTDRPLVTQNLVGGEDGIDDAGLSLSRIIPAPGQVFLEGTAQLFRGDSANLFQAARRSDVSTVEHLRAYRDISESTNIDLGGSYAHGHSPYADGSNQLFGFDATLRWKPLRRSIYHSFVGRTELIWARTTAPSNVLAGATSSTVDLGPAYVAKPFGFYVSADYQLGRRWFLGGRFDRSERAQCLGTDPETTNGGCNFYAFFGSSAPSFTPPLLRDTGGSILLTYWPSEFSQVRGQLRRTQYGEGRTANELLLQLQFSMGAHGAHPF
ncbi:MAG: hypothetical protein ABSC23_15285 [Bryobacteraceae bacterium]